MDTGEAFTRWTVRLALGLYVLALALRLLARQRRGWLRGARLAWTLGCLAYLAHVVCAFQFYHGWSHAAAYRETARQTAAQFGLDWGGGVYVNYAFTVVWLADVFWWWRGVELYEARPCWLEAAVQVFLAFIAFNATVVFGTGPVRWLGLAASLGLGLLWLVAGPLKLARLRRPAGGPIMANSGASTPEEGTTMPVEPERPAPPAGGTEVATLGGGCFWCLEAVFEQLRGVTRVESGYAGGTVDRPTYQQVCSGSTGHAEVVQVTFDPAVLSFREVLDVFFATHDPTTLNRQGPDFGTQYRSAIFSHSPEQKRIAEERIAELNAADIWGAPIVTQVVPLQRFYPAEDYHQEYFRQHPSQPYCQAVVAPKVAKFRKQFANKLRA
jgi:peptide-methionine (S)-S-oxide reductase